MPRFLRLSRTGFAYFALLAVLLVCQFGASLLCSFLWPALTEHPLYVWVLSFLPLYGIAMPVCLLILRREPCIPDPEPKQAQMTVGKWFLALLIAFGLMFVGSIMGSLLNALLGALTGKAITNPVSDLVMDGDPWLTILCTVILAPLGEEFLFRRLLIDRTRHLGDKTAVLLSALMFGAFHLNLHQFFYAFLVGLVFGYLYLRTGKLRWSVALHAALNLVGSVLMPMLLRRFQPLLDLYSSGMPDPSTQTQEVIGTMLSLLPELALLFAYYTFVLGSVISVIVLAITCRKRLHFSATPEQPRAAFLDVGILCFFLLCAVMIFFI